MFYYSDIPVNPHIWALRSDMLEKTNPPLSQVPPTSANFFSASSCICQYIFAVFNAYISLLAWIIAVILNKGSPMVFILVKPWFACQNSCARISTSSCQWSISAQAQCHYTQAAVEYLVIRHSRDNWTYNPMCIQHPLLWASFHACLSAKSNTQLSFHHPDYGVDQCF